MRDPVGAFYRAALECIYARDWSALDQGFTGLPEAVAQPMVRALTLTVLKHAEFHRDWHLVAELPHRMPMPGRREAARIFAERLRAFEPAPGPPADTRRPDLSRLALRLLRAGAITSAELLRKLDDANAQLVPPLAGEIVGKIAVWAANNVGQPHGA